MIKLARITINNINTLTRAIFVITKMMLNTITTDTTNVTNPEKKFSAKEFFAQWQEILSTLILSTFGVSGEIDSTDERVEQFVLDVEAATSLYIDRGIPTADDAELKETEQQLRSSSMLMPLLLFFIAGHDPSVDLPAKSFIEQDYSINLVGSEGLGSEGDIHKFVKFCNSRVNGGDCFLRAGDCQGEVYLLPGAGVFKPEFTKMATTRLRHGFEGVEHQREIAAFRVDQAYGGFARVPPTAPVTIFSDSLPDQDKDSAGLVSGSLQKWVPNIGSSEDMGSSRFNINDIHHIGILDVLLYNTDRHAGNMLVAESASCAVSCGKGKARLVPIDHGLCLPDFRHLNQAEFEWLYWRQAQQPLSKDDLELIGSFDGDKVAGILRGLNLSSGSVLTARLMVNVLQQTAVDRGWNLREIGTFCTQAFNAKSSDLADVVAATIAAAGVQDSEVPFEGHAAFMDLFNQQLAKHLDAKIKVVGSRL